MEFESFVEAALEFVRNYSNARGRPPREFEDYVQKRVLDHLRGLKRVVRFEGVTVNLSHMHTGAAERSNGNVVKLLRDGDRPAVTGDSFRGATRKYLVAMSKLAGVLRGRDCRSLVASERGVKDYVNCGTCFACGILGFMNLNGVSFGKRLTIGCGKVLDGYEVMVKPRIIKDAVTDTVNWASVVENSEKNSEAEGDGEPGKRGKTTLFHLVEYGAPGTIAVPIYVTMTNMAVAEMGLALHALQLAMMKVCGTGWQTWKDEPTRWKLVCMPVHPGPSEVYAGPRAVEVVDKMVEVARTAVEKRLFKPYMLQRGG